jgi:DNA-binding beta-propeller fold protein YncE
VRTGRWLVIVLFAACTGGEDPTGPEPGGPDELDCRTPGHICTFAGTGDRGWGEAGGAPEDTTLFLPTDVAFDLDGQPIVVDYNNMRILRHELDGTLQTVVGMGVHAYATDGIDARSTPLENPVAMAVGPDGTWFLNEQHGARILAVRDGWLTVHAGPADDPGAEGWSGDGGPALDARMSQGVGLTAAPDGTLYIGDTGNHVVRVVHPDGTMGTLAGGGEPGFVDGDPSEARFHTPQHVAWHDGYVYVADTNNHAVRRIDAATGEVVTVAGGNGQGFGGDGGPAVDATLDTPQGVGVDALGRVYIADSENHVVRRIETDGTLTHWAGTPGEPDLTGDGGPALEARLDWPVNVSVGPDGVVYIADTLNSVIRAVAPDEAP